MTSPPPSTAGTPPAPAPGVYDESALPDGSARPHWAGFRGAFEALPAEERGARRESVRRLLREHGVTYTVHGEAASRERQWELDLIPMILPAAEWAVLERGLVQRAELLNRILGDLYGPQRLLRDGLLPPSLVHANPGYLRACHGIRPPGGRFLAVHAVDLARTPDGRWWVLADRTQAPSGAGYALENRIILSQVLPDEFAAAGVRRLAGFFAAQRDGLRALSPRPVDMPTVVVLTPGPFSETYFEHAYLARYLEFPLVEGGDLTVRDRRVFIKTLEGLRPVDVILRRLDDTFCDPVELRSDSMLGVAGLVDAAHAGNVAIVNALGSGAIETGAVLAFLPALARHILGEELRLPNVATWWCGQRRELEHTLAHLDRLVVKRAFAGAGDPVFGHELGASRRAELASRIRARPQSFLGQERLTLSVAPAWSGERLEPRPLVLRAFVTATADGWQVMPGGLTRVSPASSSQVVSSARGGASKDTWVLSDGPVESITLLVPRSRTVHLERRPAEVPSRVADNMFWLGRYLERIETVVRQLRAVVFRLEGEAAAGAAPELAALVQMLVWLGVLPDRFGPETRPPELETVIDALLFQGPDAGRPGVLGDLVQRMRYIAASLRDRLSMDSWRILQRLLHDGSPRPARPGEGSAAVFLNTLVVDLAAFSGMAMENMTRGHAWRFLDIGRRIERGQSVVRLLRAALSQDVASPARLLPLLEILESKMTYRRMYFERLDPASVFDLLLHGDTNPRSLTFQVAEIGEDLAFLQGRDPADAASPERRELESLARLLGEADVVEAADAATAGDPGMMDQLLVRMDAGLGMISDQITHRYFSHAITRVS